MNLSAGTEVFQSIETSSQTDFEFILIQSIDSNLLIAIAANVFLSVLKNKLILLKLNLVENSSSQSEIGLQQRFKLEKFQRN